MFTPAFRPLLTVGVALVMAVGVVAAEPAILAKARARLGAEEALEGVRTLHYTGTLELPDPVDPTKVKKASVEIYLEKPDRQRIEIQTEEAIDVKVLDGYDAWSRVTDAKDPTKWQQTLLGADQIKQLRADVWQNLSFYRGLESVGGRVESQGPATIEGIACEKISFIHSPQIVYDRYFDAATGRLVYTGNDRNNIREEGEIVSGGIRFPKQILITIHSENGQTIRQRITFTKIVVNGRIAPELFEMPMAGR